MRRHHVLHLALALMICSTAHAQLRPDQPAVLTPPVHTKQPQPDIIGAFQAQYLAAGRPRVMLFWNVAFDDTTAMTRREVELTTTSSSQSGNLLDKTTQGAAGNATLRENDDKRNETVEHVRSSAAFDPSRRPINLNAAAGARLETSFREALLRAGMRLVDRAASMRLAQADNDRVGVDAKLIEADAAKTADLLLEVLAVPDPDAPLGSAFRLSIINVKDGSALAARYTLARPQLPAVAGHYTANADGFVWQQPAQARLTIQDIALELSNESLAVLGPAMPKGPLAH
jgi:hypothetical protein